MTVRQKIVEAARERFAHYGYGKTTMAEVAGDCNMSPGNLYRYFPGKLDIAEVIVRSLFERTLDTLRAIARAPGLSAIAKLTAVLHKLLEITYDECKHSLRLYEIAQSVMRERPEFAREYLAAHRAILAEILAAGKANGEFAIKDADQTAEWLQVATAKFQYPPIWTEATLEALKEQLDGVVEVLFMGLCSAKADSAQPDLAEHHL